MIDEVAWVEAEAWEHDPYRAPIHPEIGVWLVSEVRRLRKTVDDVKATLRHHATDELKVSMLDALLDDEPWNGKPSE